MLRNPRKQVSITFFLICLFVSFWAVANLLTSTPQVSLLVNQVANRLSFLFAFLAVVGCVRFSMIFPVPLHFGKRASIALAGVVAVISVLSVTEEVAGVVSRSNGNLHFSLGRLAAVYIVSILFFLGLLIRNLIQMWRKSRGNVRQQATFIMFGFGLPIMLGLALNLVLPSLTSNWQTAAFGPVCTVLLVVIIGFAIVRHHLFDLRLAIARSFAYVFSVVVIVSVYSATALYASKAFFDGTLSVQQEVFYASFSAAVALVFQPIKKFFDRFTNRVFYQDAYNSQMFLDQLNRSWVLYTDLERMLQESATIIKTNIKAGYCLFGVRSPQSDKEMLIVGSDKRSFAPENVQLGQATIPKISSNVIVTDDLPASKLRLALEQEDVGLMIRLATANPSDNFGYLIVGNKKSGNPYSLQDIQLMETVANGLTVAMQNAFRFEEIQNFNKTLQGRIEQATKELRRTNEKLKALDETKDEFITMASHQLRTPLTSVKGYLSMVLEGDAGKLNKQQEQLLTQSFISSQRMVYLIADLLNLSRLNTGKFVIEPTPLDLREVVQGEIDQLRETAKSRDLTLVYEKPASFPALMLDETKTHQVVMNFIDNAIYYTPAGGTITIELHETPTAVEYLVKDNGIGVPKAEQHRLFTKFYRAGNARRARPDGTGLGLFMAKKVIVAQGGSIIFQSEEGKGSTFGFRFGKARRMVTNAPAGAPLNRGAKTLQNK